MMLWRFGIAEPRNAIFGRFLRESVLKSTSGTWAARNWCTRVAEQVEEGLQLRAPTKFQNDHNINPYNIHIILYPSYPMPFGYLISDIQHSKEIQKVQWQSEVFIPSMPGGQVW